MINIQSSDALEKRAFNGIIFSVQGGGKTYMLNYLKGKSFVLDTDDGLSTVADSDKVNFDFQTVSSLDEALEVLTWFESNGIGKYDNFILDTASELEQLFLVEKSEKLGMPDKRDYGKIKYIFEKLLRRIKALSRKGVNVLVYAHEQTLQKQDSDGALRLVIRPLLREAYLDSATGLFDVVGRLEVSEKEATKGQRFIRLSSSSSIPCKDRLYKRAFCAAEDLIPTKKET